MTLAELRERVKGATGADRELDARLAIAIDPEWRERYEPTVRYGDGGFVQSRERPHHIRSSPAYTASVDAALALIERVLAPLGVEVSITRGGALALISIRNHPCRIEGSAPTPALALISALLAAVEAQGDAL